jgi:hypothetical protein
MKRTTHHILVCTSVHLRGSEETLLPESEHGASNTDLADSGPALLSGRESAHAPSVDWLAAWPNALDEDALDELAEALRPRPHSAA